MALFQASMSEAAASAGTELLKMLKKLLQYARSGKIGTTGTGFGIFFAFMYLQAKMCACSGHTFDCNEMLAAYSLLLSMTVVAFFMTWSGWRKWFVKKYSCCNKKTFYYKLILEEEKKVLEELLRKEANETLTKEIMSNIKRKDWDGCLNVAQQMINKAKHQKPEATNQQINWISEGSSNRGGQHHQAAAHQQMSTLWPW
ncbi:hypothetical protein ACER0C_023692 [Sarotherodon galilaeus]